MLKVNWAYLSITCYGYKDDTFLNENIGAELLPNENVDSIIIYTQVFSAYYIM